MALRGIIRLGDGKVARYIISKVRELLCRLFDPKLILGRGPFCGYPPTRGSLFSAGLDLCAAEESVIKPGGRCLVRTGLNAAIPTGYVGLICSRSGLALKEGVFVLNAPGIIDPDYRGDLGIVLCNLSSKDYTVLRGDRVAQLLIVRAISIGSYELRYSMHDPQLMTERGEGGFGSTGK